MNIVYSQNCLNEKSLTKFFSRDFLKEEYSLNFSKENNEENFWKRSFNTFVILFEKTHVNPSVFVKMLGITLLKAKNIDKTKD